MSHNPQIVDDYNGFEFPTETRRLVQRFETVLAGITMPFGWVLNLRIDSKSSKDNPRFWLYVFAAGDKCARTGEVYSWNSRDWILDDSMTDSQIIRTAWLATRAAAEHELFEFFTYNGTPLFDPHTNLPNLATFVAGKGNADQTRGGIRCCTIRSIFCSTWTHTR